jgi:cytochrome bd-type quinol oxidase subunit 2
MNIRLMIAIVLLSVFAGAQETSGKGKPIDDAAGKGQSLEAEFVASDVFRSGSLIIPFARKFAFEGHYFVGTPTETETGFTGVSWAFSLKEFKLIPGVGAIFGNNQFTASAAVLFR